MSRTAAPGLRSRLGFLLRDAAVYGLATGLNRVVKIVLVPIVAKSYPADIYGAFDTLSVYLYVAAALAILGLNSSVIIVATADGQASSAAHLREPATTAFRVVLGVSVLVALAVAALASQASLVLLGDARFAGAVRWAAASVPFTAVLFYGLSLLQWSFRKAWYVAVALGTAVVTVGLTYAVARYTSLGLEGFFMANLLGQGVGSLVAIGAARDMVSGRWSRDAVRRLLAIGLPFAVISVAGGLLPAIGRFFLVHFHSLDDAGYYGLAQKIATLLTLLMAGFQAAWAPFAFARRADPDTRRLFATVLLIVGTVVAYASVVLVLLAPWLASTAATAEYGVSVTYVGPLALAAGMSPLFAVVAIGSLFEGRSVHNLVAYMIGLLITVGLNVLLAARHAPPVGIAWASLAGQVAAVVLMAVLSHRVYPVRFPFARLSVLLLAAAGAVAWLGAVVGVLTPGARAVTSALVTLLVLGWIWLAVLEPSHRTRIRRYVRWRSGEAT